MVELSREWDLVTLMSNLEKTTFLKEDLYYELRCLLGAATIWQVYREDEQGFHVVVAMDSAMVHARCLFNFFTRGSKRFDIRVADFGCRLFKSGLYDVWEEALHRHVLHISHKRLTPSMFRVVHT